MVGGENLPIATTATELIVNRLQVAAGSGLFAVIVDSLGRDSHPLRAEQLAKDILVLQAGGNFFPLDWKEIRILPLYESMKAEGERITLLMNSRPGLF